MARLGNPLVQVAIAILAALALGLLLQSDWYGEFSHAHHTLRNALGIFIFPAVLFAVAAGGHGASTFEATFGLIFQFLAMLWLGRLLYAAYLKLEASMTK